MTEPVTWTISQLIDWVNAVVNETLGGEIWVEGEIANLQRSTSGHVYFTLTEARDPSESARGGSRPPNTLSVTLFKWHRESVNRHLRTVSGNVRMSDGVRVRVRGSIEIYGPRSQFQLRMTGIDPVFTLGTMAAERARILAALAEEGVLGANRSLPLPIAPGRIAVITSVGSAAHADVLDELARSTLALDIMVIDSRVQGPEAPALLRAAVAIAERAGVELILMVRGGGARTDLAAFDDELLARAIAACPIPVWTGLGHEVDRAIADEVAQRCLKTPTACAGGVVENGAAAATRVEELWEETLRAVVGRLDGGSQRLGLISSRLSRTAVTDLRAAESAVVAASQRLSHRAEIRLNAAQSRLVSVTDRLRTAPGRAATTQSRRLEAAAATVKAYDPARAMARGWSITRTADGRIATASTASPGTRLITSLADATVSSVVTDIGIDETA